MHYRSDHHRYNMKRRVASLPPVSALVFNQKVLDRRQETAIMSSLNGSTCDVCKYVPINIFSQNFKADYSLLILAHSFIAILVKHMQQRMPTVRISTRRNIKRRS